MQSMVPRFGFWAGSKYNLSRMTMADLVRAYFTHYAVVAYIALSVVGAIATVALAPSWGAAPLIALAALAAVIVYPLVWYALHRWVLHGRMLYKSALTARVWKRIHFDHHQDPHDLGVLFGALYTMLPSMVIITLSLGWLIAGSAGASACLAAALLTLAANLLLKWIVSGQSFALWDVAAAFHAIITGIILDCVFDPREAREE